MGPETNSANNEPRGIVAVGASAGGVEALTNMAAGMPCDFPFAVVVVLHMPPGAPSVLAKILDRSGPLPACSAVDGMRLKPGQIHVAVPDHHLLIEDHRAVLSAGPTENGYRPAINALFRSAALAYGPRAIGLLLSGVLDDGVLGAAAIRSRGGVTLVQHPNDALYAAMPLNAVEAGVVDHQVTAAGAGQLLMQLVDRPPEDEPVGRDANMELENRIARAKRFSTSFDTEDLGPPSGYVCPDCNGSLQSVAEGNSATSGARQGMPGQERHCFGRATRTSTARCGSRCAACRRRPNWRAGWPTTSAPGSLAKGTAPSPTKPNAP